MDNNLPSMDQLTFTPPAQQVPSIDQLTFTPPAPQEPFRKSMTDFKKLRSTWNDPISAYNDQDKAGLKSLFEGMDDKQKEQALKRNHLIAYYSDTNHGNFDFVDANLDGIMKEYHGKDMTVDSAHAEIGNIFSGTSAEKPSATGAYFSNAWNQVQKLGIGVVQSSESLINAGRILTIDPVTGENRMVTGENKARTTEYNKIAASEKSDLAFLNLQRQSIIKRSGGKVDPAFEQMQKTALGSFYDALAGDPISKNQAEIELSNLAKEEYRLVNRYKVKKAAVSDEVSQTTFMSSIRDFWTDKQKELDQKIQETTPQYDAYPNMEIDQVLAKHGAEAALEKLGVMVADTLPQTITPILIGLLNPEVGLVMMGTGQAGQQQSQLNDNRDITLEAKAANAIAYGTAETIFEGKFGSYKYLKMLEATPSLAKAIGTGIFARMASFGKAVAGGIGNNELEELSTLAAEKFADLMTGTDSEGKSTGRMTKDEFIAFMRKGVLETALITPFIGGPMGAAVNLKQQIGYSELEAKRNKAMTVLGSKRDELKNNPNLTDEEVSTLNVIETALESNDMDAVSGIILANAVDEYSKASKALNMDETAAANEDGESGLTDEEAADKAVKDEMIEQKFKHHPDDSAAVVQKLQEKYPDLKIDFYDGDQGAPDIGAASWAEEGHGDQSMSPGFVDMNTGKVFVNTRLVRPHGVEKFVLQEYVRHYGLEETFKALDKKAGLVPLEDDGSLEHFLDRVANDYNDDVSAFAEKYAPIQPKDPAAPRIANNYDMNTVKGRRNATKEFLAHSSKLDVKPLKWNEKIILWFKDLLRKAGFDQPLSTREIEGILSNASDYLAGKKIGRDTRQNSTNFVKTENVKFKMDEKDVLWHKQQIDKIEPVKPIELNVPYEKLHNAVIEYATKNYLVKNTDGSYSKTVNDEKGIPVTITKSKIKKSISGHSGEQKISLVTVLPEMIEKAHYTGEESDNKQRVEIKAFHHYYIPVQFGENKYYVRLIVTEIYDGRRFYDHELTKFDNEAGITEAITKLRPHPATSLSDNTGIQSPEKSSFKVKFSISTDQLGFYSAIEKAVDESKQPVNSKEGWLKWLRNVPGIKAEEIEWIGLDGLPEGKISKDKLLEFVRANSVQVKEVVKGGDKQFKDANGNRVLDGNGGFVDSSNSTKFENYQTPGGLNYKELLLTLPTKPSIEMDRLDNISQNLFGVSYSTLADSEIGRVNGAQKRIQVKREYFKLYGERGSDAEDRTGLFKSSHFSEPNILAHVRFNERTNADGKRVLFVEEVQSDWHQQGKKHGYKGDAERIFNDLKQHIESKYGMDLVSLRQSDRSEEKMRDLDEIDRAYRDYQNDKHSSKVPNAPFKSTWPILAMKRMIRYAAENGFDKIAWTTGEQQAQRYDLSQQVDKINWRKNSDGTYSYSGLKHDHVIVGDDHIPADKLADNIGKELAQKAIDSDNKYGSFEGVDLKIGGEGMKGFYDQILPAEVNKYAKRWGGRVGKSKIDLSTTYKNYEDFKRQHLQAWPESSEEQVKKAFEIYGKSILQSFHSLEITPSMKDSVMQGQSRFAIDSETAGAAASPYTDEQRQRMGTFLVPLMKKMMGDFPDPQIAYEMLKQKGFPIRNVSDAQSMLVQACSIMRKKASEVNRARKTKWMSEQYPLLAKMQREFGDKAKVKPSPEFIKDVDFSAEAAGDFLTKRAGKNTLAAADVAAKLGVTEQKLLDQLKGMTSTGINSTFKAYLEMKKERGNNFTKMFKQVQDRRDFAMAVDIAKGKKPLTDIIIAERPSVAQIAYQMVMGEPMPQEPRWSEVRQRILEDYPENVAKTAAEAKAEAPAPEKLDEVITAVTVRGELNVEKLQPILKDYVRSQIKDEDTRKTMLEDIDRLSEYSSQPTSAHPEGRQQAMLEDLLGKVIGEREKIDKTVLLQAIDDLLDRSNLRRTFPKGRPVSLLASMQKTLDYIREVRNMSPEVADRIAEYHQEMIDNTVNSAKGFEETETHESEYALKTINMYGNLEGKSPEHLSEVYKNIENLMRHGRDELNLILGAKAARAEDMRNDTIITVTAGKGLMTVSEDIKNKEKQAKNIFIKGAMNTYLPAMNLENILRWITGNSKVPFSETGIYKTLFTPIHVSWEKRSTGIRKMVEARDKASDEIFGTKGPIERGVNMAKQLELELKTGVFVNEHSPNTVDPVTKKVKFIPGKKYVSYDKITVEDARKLLSRYDNRDNATLSEQLKEKGSPALAVTEKNTGKIITSLLDYQAEMVRHQLADMDEKLKDAYAKGYRFNDEVSDPHLKALEEEISRSEEGTIVLPMIMKQGEPKERALSQESAAYYWLLSRQPSIRYQLHFNGWTEESFKQLEKFLTPETKKMALWYVSYLKDSLPRINEVYKRISSTELTGNENYFPVSHKGEAADPGNIYAGDMQIMPGFTATRKAHLAEPPPQNMTSMFMAHNTKMEHFIACAETGNDLRTVFKSKAVKLAIEQQYGEETYKALLKKVGYFVNAGNAAAQKSVTMARLQGIWAGSKMLINSSSFFKQLAGHQALAQDIPIKDLELGIAKFLNPLDHPEEKAKMLMETDFWINRYGGSMDRDIGLLMNRSHYSNKATDIFFDELTKKGMLPTRVGDGISTIAGGWAVYNYHFEKLKEAGLSESEAHKQALLEWEMTVNRTQQSGAPHMMNDWQLGGNLASFITTFNSNPYLVANNLIAAIHEVAKGKPGSISNLGRAGYSAFLINGLAMEAISQMAKNGIDLDKYSFWKMFVALLIGPFGSLTMWDMGLTAIIEQTAGIQTRGGTGMPIIDDSARAITGNTKFFTGDMTDEELYKTIEKDLGVIQFLPLVGLAAMHSNAVMRELRRYYNIFFGSEKQ